MKLLSSAALGGILGLAALFSMMDGGAALAADPVAAGGTGQPLPAAAGTPAATLKTPVLDCPIGIAINRQDELFVVNHWQPNTFCGFPGQILVFDKDGHQLADRTITAGLSNPAAIAFDKSGNIYVTDYAKQEVLVYDSKGKPIPSRTLHTDKGYNPSGVQIDSSGDVWVNNRQNSNITIGELQIFHKTGRVDKITEGLIYPVGVVFQAKSGKAWIGNAETPSGNSFAVFSSAAHFLGNVSTAPFTPTYLAYAKNGDLYATDPVGTNEVGIFSPKGSQIGSPITAGLDEPYGIAFDKEGDFYVANIGSSASTITKYSPSGKLICTIAKTGCH